MRKYTKSPELYSCKSSSTLKKPKKNPQNSKVPPSLSSKILSIKSKLSEILSKKEKVKRDLIKVQKHFKLSQKKEQNLEILSNSIKNRISNLEKRKALLKLSRSGGFHESNSILFLQLSNYLKRFKQIMQQELQLEEAEQELYMKEEDLSFETRSSESTQAVSIQKDVSQFELLKNAVSRTGDKKQSIARNSSFYKYKIEVLQNKKELILSEIFELDLEIEQFQIEKEGKSGFKQKVLSKREVLERRIVENDEEKKRLIKVLERNKKIRLELRMLQDRIKGKVLREMLEKAEVNVEEVEEKVMILNDSVKERKILVENLRKRVKMLNGELSARIESIKKKEELNEILRKIEEEVNLSRIKGTGEEGKSRVRELVRLALDKEKEVKASEKIGK